MKITITDDDKLVAISLKTILEAGSGIEVAAIGSCGEEAISLYSEHRPDVALMDIRMNGMTGLEAGEKILSEFPEAKILFLTTFSDDEYIAKALSIGAKGYILKQDFEGIAPALEAVNRGQRVFGDAVIDKLPEVIGTHRAEFSPESYDLNEREMQIIELVGEVPNNKEIASSLFLSEGTVRNSVSLILEKLSLRDRTQLAVFYFKNIAK